MISQNITFLCLTVLLLCLIILVLIVSIFRLLAILKQKQKELQNQLFVTKSPIPSLRDIQNDYTIHSNGFSQTNLHNLSLQSNLSIPVLKYRPKSISADSNSLKYDNVLANNDSEIITRGNKLKYATVLDTSSVLYNLAFNYAQNLICHRGPLSPKSPKPFEMTNSTIRQVINPVLKKGARKVLLTCLILNNKLFEIQQNKLKNNGE